MDRAFKLIAEWAEADGQIVRAHIFGSRARGDARADSDIDVAIEFALKYNDLANWIIRADELRESLQPAMPCKLDLQWYGGSEETPIIHAGLEDAKITIYDTGI